MKAVRENRFLSSVWVMASILSAPLAVSAAPPNDAFAAAVALEGPSGSTSGTNVGATREAGEPMIDGYEGGRSVWWIWTAPAAGEVVLHTLGSSFDTILGVYRGTGVASLRLVAENDDPDQGDGLHSVVSFMAVAGDVYHIAVDGVDGDTGPESGDIVLSWLSGGPPNDDFSDGTMLGEAGSTSAVNFGATIEPGEPKIDSSDGGRSVWWRWVAPRSERVSVLTLGSNFDTLLGVYTGTALNALALVGDNDDTERFEQSRVDFEATAGTLYHLVVDGFDGESGNIILTWGSSSEVMPENDSFASRTRLEGAEGQVVGSTIGATREASEPDHVQSGGTASVWWSWVAPGNGTGKISTFGSSFDTVLAVYTGDSVERLVLVAENDDDETMDVVTSALVFRATSGREYQIAVDGFDGESGLVSLRWSLEPEPENPRFIRGDCDGDGNVNITDAVCMLEWLFQGGKEPDCAAATNADGTEDVNLTDPIHLLLHLFAGGPAPAAPFPVCGLGTLETDNEMGCWKPPETCR